MGLDPNNLTTQPGLTCPAAIGIFGFDPPPLRILITFEDVAKCAGTPGPDVLASVIVTQMPAPSPCNWRFNDGNQAWFLDLSNGRILDGVFIGPPFTPLFTGVPNSTIIENGRVCGEPLGPIFGGGRAYLSWGPDI